MVHRYRSESASRPGPAIAWSGPSPHPFPSHTHLLHEAQVRKFRLRLDRAQSNGRSSSSAGGASGAAGASDPGPSGRPAPAGMGPQAGLRHRAGGRAADGKHEPQDDDHKVGTAVRRLGGMDPGVALKGTRHGCSSWDGGGSGEEGVHDLLGCKNGDETVCPHLRLSTPGVKVSDRSHDGQRPARRRASGWTEPTTPHPAKIRRSQATPEQRTLVERIRTTTTYYEVLSVSRTASDEDLKK